MSLFGAADRAQAALEGSKGLLVAAAVLLIGITLVLLALALRPGAKWATAALAGWLVWAYMP